MAPKALAERNTRGGGRKAASSVPALALTEADGTAAPFSARYQQAIELIGQRWTGAIVRSLLAGNCRFSDIRASVPDLSDRLLWERLKALEAEGLVERMVVNRRHTAYRLTPKGEALRPVVRATVDWAQQWLSPPRAGKSTRRHRRR